MDPLTIMNAVCRWESPPPIDERWTKKVAALCEYVAAVKRAYEIRTLQYRRRCEGVVRDTKLEGELIEAVSEVQRIEEFFGLA